MKLKRANYAIAVMVVTTALCADRTAVADVALPQRPVQSGIARTLAAKLTSSFQQAVMPVRFAPAQSNEAISAPRLPIREAASGVHQHSATPFQFRLPPPAR
jgi:hypothetical protein